ncbi:hypothetical protein RchiOBHm_Chr5g0063431 [Rosa chinensis]|uniref:Uncharacterized protein n=1 Tax=Rosa chinensis TaxID=74649 RepID=A0A2P6QIG8_ROSCH|nr:hypothetical protein RchiOBHm_Chr5g0063431 [Rosa chinensis]
MRLEAAQHFHLYPISTLPLTPPGSHHRRRLPLPLTPPQPLITKTPSTEKSSQTPSHHDLNPHPPPILDREASFSSSSLYYRTHPGFPAQEAS